MVANIVFSGVQTVALLLLQSDLTLTNATFTGFCRMCSSNRGINSIVCWH